MSKKTGTQEDQEKKSASTSFNTGQVLQTVLLVSVVLATLFTLWNPYKLFAQQGSVLPTYQNNSNNSSSNYPTIGILVGHWKVDSGHICANGIIEADVMEAIANLVSMKLNALGYPVKLLAETDLELVNFRGPLLIALYAGSCDDTPDNQSGFTIGTALSTANLNLSNALAACLGERYQEATKLDFSYAIISSDQPMYTYFEMVNPQTPMIYLEIGSLLRDQTLLIEDSEKVANGIVNGIQCYLASQEKVP